ncbi:hypothetical protein BGZ63DRAFT_398983 [Mariannaea sp. PMI_226]|nr:hypothetical protein BGZ63DRAFT_398983 [Mariannaea sp. PMI_226]
MSPQQGNVQFLRSTKYKVPAPSGCQPIKYPPAGPRGYMFKKLWSKYLRGCMGAYLSRRQALDSGAAVPGKTPFLQVPGKTKMELRLDLSLFSDERGLLHPSPCASNMLLGKQQRWSVAAQNATAHHDQIGRINVSKYQPKVSYHGPVGLVRDTQSDRPPGGSGLSVPSSQTYPSALLHTIQANESLIESPAVNAVEFFPSCADVCKKGVRGGDSLKRKKFPAPECRLWLWFEGSDYLMLDDFFLFEDRSLTRDTPFPSQCNPPANETMHAGLSGIATFFFLVLVLVLVFPISPSPIQNDPTYKQLWCRYEGRQPPGSHVSSWVSIRQLMMNVSLYVNIETTVSATILYVINHHVSALLKGEGGRRGEEEKRRRGENRKNGVLPPFTILQTSWPPPQPTDLPMRTHNGALGSIREGRRRNPLSIQPPPINGPTQYMMTSIDE